MRRLLTPRWLAGHAFVWASVAAFLALGWWQAGRAAEGNSISWAYTFEWPLFAIFMIVLWVREMRQTLRSPLGETKPENDPVQVTPQRRAPVITRREATLADGDDPELAEYNRLLAWLSANPGAKPGDYSVKESR